MGTVAHVLSRASRRSRLRRPLPGTKRTGTRHVREARAIELRANAAVERRSRERHRSRLGRVENEAAERRHRMRAGAVGADELGLSVCP